MDKEFLDGFKTDKLNIIKVDEKNKSEASLIYANLIKFRKETYGMKTPRFRKVLDKKCLPPKKKSDCFYFYLIKENQINAAIGLLAIYKEWPSDNTLFIGIFYIDEGYKGKGYGTDLVSKLSQCAKPYYDTFMIRVHQINKYKPEFFFKNGFVSHSTLPGNDEILIKQL